MSLRPESTSQPSTFPIVLAAARHIHDLAIVVYPEGIQGPSVELNVNVGGGKFRYDRAFLLQFMNICTVKPNMLLEPDPAPKITVACSLRWGRHHRGSGSLAAHRVAIGPGSKPTAGSSEAGSIPGLSELGSEERPNTPNRPELTAQERAVQEEASRRLFLMNMPFCNWIRGDSTPKRSKRKQLSQTSLSSNTRKRNEGTKVGKSARDRLPQAYYYL